jgi:hypothetical protein
LIQHLRRTLTVLVAAAGLAAMAIGAGATSAAAYGNDAVYQVGFAFNCDDPTAAVCQLSSSNPFGPGGFWGWVELDGTAGAIAGTEGNVEVTGCSHNGVTGPTGAQHFSLTIVSWFTTSDPRTGQLVVVAIPNGGPPFAFPAAPGHYSFDFLPGVNGQIQVDRLS